jgi:hypothetical protein
VLPPGLGAHSNVRDTLEGEDLTDCIIAIDRPGEPYFPVVHFSNGHMISTDGRGDRIIEVALWVINSFPVPDGVEVWVDGPGLYRPRRPASSMTADEVKTGWLEHN